MSIEMCMSEASNNMISVHYPGVIRNETNMLDTLGGIRTISTVFNEKNRRLELRMRPGDAYSKPAYGGRKTVCAILLKVKVKKKKRKIVCCEVLGHVSEEFRFMGLCDFQYLPMTKDSCLYDHLMPKGLDLTWLSSDVPHFLPPVAFSRIDSVQNYTFSKTNAPEEETNVIGRIKRKRYGCTQFLSFENPDIPTAPKDPPSGGVFPTKIVTADMLNLLKKLFEERPIYSRAAIGHVSQLPLIQLKVMLPCVAFYFTNGPWRALWVRFGFDPRTTSDARIYQTLDYRVRSGLGKNEVRLKRLSVMSAIPRKSVPLSQSQAAGAAGERPQGTEDCMPHIFRPELIPPSRQCYYQYCDIEVPEIQALLEAAPVATECHEVHGWLPQGMADECRQIMNTYVAEELKKRGESTGAPRAAPAPASLPAATADTADGSDGDSDYEGGY